MTRSGYDDDLDPLELGRWRAAVASAIRGKRGQAMLRDLLAALDAMPEKKLVAESFSVDEGCCALGALGRERGIDMKALDEEASGGVLDGGYVGHVFGIAESLAREVMAVNDEGGPGSETDEERWVRVRAWVAGMVERGEVGLESY